MSDEPYSSHGGEDLVSVTTRKNVREIERFPF